MSFTLPLPFQRNSVCASKCEYLKESLKSIRRSLSEMCERARTLWGGKCCRRRRSSLYRPEQESGDAEAALLSISGARLCVPIYATTDFIMPSLKLRVYHFSCMGLYSFFTFSYPLQTIW